MKRLLLICCVAASVHDVVIASAEVVPSPSPSTSQASTSPSVVLDQSTPKALLRSFFASGGEVDEATLRSLLHASTPLEQKVLDSVVQVELAHARLRAVTRERFGAATGTTTAPTMASSQGLDVDTVQDIEALSEKVEGDRATIGSPMDPKIKMELVRVGGKWKLPVASHAAALDPGVADTLAATARAQVEITDGVTADVKAGKFSSQEQVRQELARRFAERIASATRPSNSSSATQPAGT